MEPANRTAAIPFKLFAASLVLGILGDLVLRNEAWGVSLPIFTAMVAGVVFLVGRSERRTLSRAAVALLGAAVLFSLLFAWREAPELKFINTLAVFSLLGLAALQVNPKPITTAPMADFLLKALCVWAVFLADFSTLVFSDVKWARAVKERGLGGLSAAARGVILAIPLLIVFGALLASADAGFQHLLDSFTDFDGEAVFSHVIVAGICAVATGGLLRHLFIATQRPAKPELPYVLAPHYHSAYPTEPFRLGWIEVAIVLGSLDLLFGVFVLLQLPYLFGGQAHIASTPNLGWGTYAHRGFFELVAVVGLAIPVLLGSHALMKTADRLWRGLAVVMVTLLFVIMQSAVDRMRLYVFFYQLSTQRIYALASLGWMALALLWFLATTVRGKPERFAFGAFAGLLAMVFVVNAINPDGLVARYNVNNARIGRAFDGAYLAGLSLDAAPELAAAWSRLDEETRQAVLSRWQNDTSGSWRCWTACRSAASNALSRKTRVTLSP